MDGLSVRSRTDRLVADGIPQRNGILDNVGRPKRKRPLTRSLDRVCRGEAQRVTEAALGYHSTSRSQQATAEAAPMLPARAEGDERRALGRTPTVQRAAALLLAFRTPNQE
jgi:hypothetical protein